MVEKSNEQPILIPAGTGNHVSDGLHLMAQEAYPVAVKEFTRALAEDPNGDSEVWYFRGYAFSRMQVFDAALADFDQCLTLAPSFGLAHLEKGRIHSLLGHHEDAVESFGKARDFLGPNNPEYCIQMARSYAQLRQFSEAISLLNRSIAIKPQYTSLLIEKAEWQNELGLHVDGINTCDGVLSIDPTSCPAFWTKAIAQSHLRQFSEARKSLEEVLQLPWSLRQKINADLRSFAKTLDLLVQVQKQAPFHRAAVKFQIPNVTQGQTIPGSEFSVGDPVNWSWIVIKLLGDPATSKTHCVYDVRNGSRAVMKRFPMQATGRSFDFKSWEPELQLWSALARHPNLLLPFRIDEHNNNVCLFSENLGEHSSLSDSLKGGAIEYLQALRWGCQFCDGMIFAADHGVLAHYNLKPSNILIDNLGNLRLTDFDFRQCGAARNVSEPGEGLPIAVDLLPYVPPERFEGFPVDVRSDIYSFGVLLALMVSGRHPLGDGNRIRFGDAEQAATWRDLHRSSPSLVIEGPISKIIAKCLATEIEDRYQDFSSVREDLEVESAANGDTYLSGSLLSESSEQLCHRGRTYWNMGKWDDAIKAYRKALELNPFNDAALNGLGATLDKIQQRGAAMYYYQKAVKLHGGSAPLAWTNIGTTKQHEKRHREALIYFQKALDLEPRCSSPIWHFKGKSHRALGQLQEALRCFSTAVEVDPRNVDAREDRDALCSSIKGTSDNK